MSIWQKLGFGGGPDEAGESPAPTSEDGVPTDITSSHDVIHNSSGDAYWEQFELSIERLSARELNMLNYRLGAGVPDNSNWRDYVEAFRMYQWFRFCEAYHYATNTYYAG